MKRLIKWNRFLIVLGLVLLGYGAYAYWWLPAIGMEGALVDTQMIARSEIEVTPHFTAIVDVKSLHKQIKLKPTQTPWLLAMVHQQIGLAIPYHPSCPGRELWRKSESFVAMGFSGMRLLYVSIHGSFDANAYMKCMSKHMKRKRIGGQAVYVGDETYWWVGQKGSLIGMGVNPRPPMFSFGHVQRVPLLGDNGLLMRTMQANGYLRQGVTYRPIHEKSSHPFSGGFLIEGLEDMNLPRGITIKFHRMLGLVRFGKELTADVMVAMRRRKHAMRVMGIYHLASSLAPRPIRSLLEPLKAKRKGRRVRLLYREKMSVLLEKAEQWLKLQTKKKTKP